MTAARFLDLKLETRHSPKSKEVAVKLPLHTMRFLLGAIAACTIGNSSTCSSATNATSNRSYFFGDTNLLDSGFELWSILRTNRLPSGRTGSNGNQDEITLDTNAFRTWPAILDLARTNPTAFQLRSMEPEEAENFWEELHEAEDGITRLKPPATAIKIDGKFDDWLGRSNAWENLPATINSTNEPISFEVFGLNYFNDSNYLYLSLKLTPSIQLAQENLSRLMIQISEPSGHVNLSELPDLGSVVLLYFDNDDNPTSGARLRSAELSGTELLVEISGESSFVLYEDRAPTFPSRLFYSVYEFDALSGGFKSTGVQKGTKSRIPILRAGNDGLEMALLLADLRLKPGDKFTMVTKGSGQNERPHRTAIRLN